MSAKNNFLWKKLCALEVFIHYSDYSSKYQNVIKFALIVLFATVSLRLPNGSPSVKQIFGSFILQSYTNYNTNLNLF